MRELPLPWEPRGSQIDIRTRDFQALRRKDLSDLVGSFLVMGAFNRTCSWTDMVGHGKKLGVTIGCPKDKRSRGGFLHVLKGFVEFTQGLLKQSIPMGANCREVEGKRGQRRGGAKRGDHEVTVEVPLAEAGPKAGGEDHVLGPNLTPWSGQNCESLILFYSSDLVSYSLLDAQDVPLDAVGEGSG